MMVVHSLALARAEKALNEAADLEALEAAWDEYCDFPDESEERDFLLAVYRERAEQMALRLAEILRA
jgi:hypothetical protein